MNYAEISKETISYLYKSYNSLKSSPLDPKIKTLIELRVSQINGCDYCCKVHWAEAEDAQVSAEKLNSLVSWNSSGLFNDKEIIALKWCEALTLINKDEISDLKIKLNEYFIEREIVDLTMCITLMNALNRIAISLKDI